MNICYVIAMQAEAQPFIEHYNVKEVVDFFKPLPCKLYQTVLSSGTALNIVLNGQQHGSDLVGCESAAITTLSAIQKLSPDIIINSGTCGAFKSNGAHIADVYLGNSAMFHDRRVPGDNEFGTQTIGNYPVYKDTSKIADVFGYKLGKVTTGSSLDMQPYDLDIIKQNSGELKDMEGAAVAFVCSLMNVPVLLVKSVTDLCDSTADTYEEFSKNLTKASESLRVANINIIDWFEK